MKRFLLILFLLAPAGWAEEKYSEPEETEPPKTIELIDVPTAQTLEYGAYNTNFRFDAAGGLTSRLVFGVLRPINLGISFDIDGMIGNQPLEFRRPGIYFKARAYGGSLRLPAIALGYDGQGYGRFDNEANVWTHAEKGIFLSLTKELAAEGLEWTLGTSINNFNQGADAQAFFGVSYDIEHRVLLIAEYDNIRDLGTSRFNLGLRARVIRQVYIDFAARNIFRGPNSERILRIDYRGLF